MLARRRGRFTAATALLLAACFGFALVASVARHTDDGCAVELHCFACHWAFASTGDAALPITHGPVLERAGDVLAFEAPPAADAPAPASSSRGPPVA
jgi:hypothetical protein